MLQMRVVQASVIVSICATLGLAAGGGWWWARGRQYSSIAVVRPASQDDQVINEAMRSVLGDAALGRIIEHEDLYPEERREGGTPAAIATMRDRGIRIHDAENIGRVVILTFKYRDGRRAQAAVRDLVETMQATGVPLEVLDGPSTPLEPAKAEAAPFAVGGFMGGLILGLALAALW